MTGIPGRGWHLQTGETLMVELTEDTDAEVLVWINGPADSVFLAPALAREVAGELIRRADLIDPHQQDGVSA